MKVYLIVCICLPLANAMMMFGPAETYQGVKLMPREQFNQGAKFMPNGQFNKEMMMEDEESTTSEPVEEATEIQRVERVSRSPESTDPPQARFPFPHEIQQRAATLHVEEPTKSPSNLRGPILTRGIQSTSKCPTTPECTKEGGKDVTRDECLRIQGSIYVANGDAPQEDSGENCVCCIPPANENPGGQVDINDFELKNIMFGVDGSMDNFEDEPTRFNVEMFRGPKGEMKIRNLHAMMFDGETAWGFSSDGATENVAECDEQGQCRAMVRGFASSPLAEKLLPGEEYGEVQVGRTINATFSMEFTDPNQDGSFKEFMKMSRTDLPFQNKNFLNGNLFIQPDPILREKGLLPRKLQFRMHLLSTWQWVPFRHLRILPPWRLFEIKRNLCVQPVRVRHRTCRFSFFGFCFSWSYQYSGAGLSFGKPEAIKEWAKADVTFTWRGWKTIIDNTGKYKSVTTAEMNALRSEVADDPHCVEVFFVPKFSPSSTYGGGATWGSGTAGAQIVTSDEQVACGVDKAHLAHELGHVLGLMHPGTGHPTFKDGSTGTLMCPSGWHHDNPRRNSRENRYNIQNPLLTYYLGFWNWYPQLDCINSVDCGSCAAHFPPDTC